MTRIDIIYQYALGILAKQFTIAERRFKFFSPIYRLNVDFGFSMIRELSFFTGRAGPSVCDGGLPNSGRPFAHGKKLWSPPLDL